MLKAASIYFIQVWLVTLTCIKCPILRIRLLWCIPFFSDSWSDLYENALPHKQFHVPHLPGMWCLMSDAGCVECSSLYFPWSSIFSVAVGLQQERHNFRSWTDNWRCKWLADYAIPYQFQITSEMMQMKWWEQYILPWHCCHDGF